MKLACNGGKMKLAPCLDVRSTAGVPSLLLLLFLVALISRRSWQLAVVFCLALSLHHICHGIALMLPGGIKLPPPAPLAMRQRTTKLRDPETGHFGLVRKGKWQEAACMGQVFGDHRPKKRTLPSTSSSEPSLE